MAFPTSVLPVRVKIAPGGQPAGDPADWQWVDITQYVRVASGITIEQGRPDEAGNVDPGKCTLTIDNRTGNFSTRNVLGQWYGQLVKNTPLRVSTVAISDPFTRTVSSGWGSTPDGQAWTVSGTAADWSTNGSVGLLRFNAANVARIARLGGNALIDVDAQFTASVPAIMTGASQVVAMILRYVDSSNYYFLSVEFDPGGTLTAKIMRLVGGVYTELAVLQPIPSLTYVANQKMRVRVAADGPDLRVKVWANGGTEPSAWLLTATDTNFTNAGLVGFYVWCVAGNTNTKPYSVSIDDIEVEDIEFTGTVPEWPPRWDKSRKDATSPLVAAGVLRRLQQGKAPLRSPITRNFLKNNPVGFWSLEDNSGAKSAAALTASTGPAAALNAEFADDTTLPGASQTVGITASTVMSSPIPAHTATGKWAVVWYTKLLAPPAATTRIMTVTSSGTIRLWAVDLDATHINLRGYGSDGTLLIDLNPVYPAEVIPPAWTALDLYVNQSGGNVTGTLLMHGVGDFSGFTFYFITGTIAGSAGSPTGWRVEGSLGYNGGHLGPIAVFNYEPAFGTGDFTAASNGYIGELAADRVKRLCDEENMPVVIDYGYSHPLGPQRTDTFLNLLYSAQDADLGVLYERGAGLAYRPHGGRIGRNVDLALDFDAGHISEPPEPTDDDQRLRNQVTVTRDNGSSATVSDDESIAASGLYDDSKTINVQTDWVLPHHASARVKLGTIDEYRWPKIDINLARNPSLIAAWRATSAFPRMTIAHEPSQVAGNKIDLVVEGTVQVLGPKGWDVTLACSPASPWSAAVVEDTVYGKADTDRSELRVQANPASTSLLVDVIEGPRLTTDPTEMPVLITAGTGEEMRITAISGTSNPQTLTVVRGLNGINVAIPAGTPIRLTNPARLAL